MNDKDKKIATHLDANYWQLYFDQLNEQLLNRQYELSQDFLRVKKLHDEAPAHNKKFYTREMNSLMKTITTIEDTYLAGRDYVGSLANSFYLEFRQLRASTNREIDEMHDSYKVMAEVAQRLCNGKISSPSNEEQ